MKKKLKSILCPFQYKKPNYNERVTDFVDKLKLEHRFQNALFFDL
ncbi:hypothetical protein [Flavobacterium azizsancarii]|nr:hypothetical protein [Flavobacterium azizsancarii]